MWDKNTPKMTTGVPPKPKPTRTLPECVVSNEAVRQFKSATRKRINVDAFAAMVNEPVIVRINPADMRTKVSVGKSYVGDDGKTKRQSYLMIFITKITVDVPAWEETGEDGHTTIVCEGGQYEVLLPDQARPTVRRYAEEAISAWMFERPAPAAEWVEHKFLWNSSMESDALWTRIIVRLAQRYPAARAAGFAGLSFDCEDYVSPATVCPAISPRLV